MPPSPSRRLTAVCNRLATPTRHPHSCTRSTLADTEFILGHTHPDAARRTQHACHPLAPRTRNPRTGPGCGHIHAHRRAGTFAPWACASVTGSPLPHQPLELSDATFERIILALDRVELLPVESGLFITRSRGHHRGRHDLGGATAGCIDVRRPAGRGRGP